MRHLRQILLLLSASALLGACSGTRPEPRDTGYPLAMAENREAPIIVTSPHSGSIVEPGFTAMGMARGSWYMEAVFPVELVADDGTVIATGSAQAKDDWMTDDFVPFEVTLDWPETAQKQAILVLRNANPSGDPERSMEVQIPVQLAKP